MSPVDRDRFGNREERTGEGDDWHRRHARLERRRPTRTVREDARRDDWDDRHARTKRST